MRSSIALNMIIKTLALLLLLISITTIRTVLAAPDEKQTSTTQPTEGEQPQRLKSPQKPTEIKQFIPTEKIKADSTVSLPVDI